MRKKKLDFTGVQSYKRCEEGIHTAKLVQLDDKETQNGDDMLAATFEVIKGDSVGAKVFDNFVLTEKALWKFKLALEAMGIKTEGKVVLDLDKLIGKVCDIEVAHEEYNGQLRARVNEYTKISVSTSDDDDEDADDDDEEEEEKPVKKSEPKSKKSAKKEPEPEDDDEDDDWDEEDEEEEPAPKKKPETKKKPEKKAPKKKPEPEEEDDDDEDWEEA